MNDIKKTFPNKIYQSVLLLLVSFAPVCVLPAFVSISDGLFVIQCLTLLSLLVMSLIVYSVFNKGLGELFSLYRKPIRFVWVGCAVVGIAILQLGLSCSGLMSNLNVTDWKLFILLVLVGPFVEEILFRGMILNGLLTRYNPILSIACSSIMFALIHFDFSPTNSALQNIMSVLFALTVGCILGYNFYKTKSLLSSSIIHSLTNMTGIVCSLYLA